MQAAGIAGEVHEREWVNFGHNRQQALELAVAANQADWLLFIDADEELGVGNSNFKENLQIGVSYDIEKHHNNVRYALPHLLDIRHNRWCWKGVVHEYIEHLEGEHLKQALPDAWIIFHIGEGARSHGVTQKEKFLRDARLLTAELKKHPKDTRSQFYLAQSYLHAGELQKALDAYRRRLEMEGYEEERFIAQLEIGRISIQLGKTERVVLQELLNAYELRPLRAEPLHALARYFREKSQFGRAYIFAQAANALGMTSDRLFVEQDIYAWRILDELAVAAYWVGQYQQSLDCGEELLRRYKSGLSFHPGDLRRINQNIAFARAKLA
jgi:tetratricopeptide (TPR) repeat protein